jgi:hypothetical protein
MEAICSSETSVETQRITWHYIPEDATLCGHYPVSCFYFKQRFGGCTLPPSSGKMPNQKRCIKYKQGDG